MHDDRQLARLVHDTVERMSLDLRGFSVLTEAATGAFAATAVMAAVGGADRVVALARESAFGSASEAMAATRRLARVCGAEPAIHVTEALTDDQLAECDIITNVGFVRPLNAARVAQLKPTAVIALMCEAWEFRIGDVDLDACRARGIVVLATNEHTRDWPIFDYCGPLAVRMLTDAGVELRKTHVAVLGGDPFTPVIVDALVNAGAIVRHDSARDPAAMRETIQDADAIMVAEYSSGTTLIGDDALLSSATVRQVAPHATVVQFAGVIDAASLDRHEIRLWPRPPVGAHRMSRTLAHLGPQPVVELHAAGLAVGALGARARRAGLSMHESIDVACRQSALAQRLPQFLEEPLSCD